MKFRNLFLNDGFILGLIILNALVIFIEGFGHAERTWDLFETVFTMAFIYEMYVKISTFGFRSYIAQNWNKFDFILVLISLPSLAILFTDNHLVETNVFMTLRVLRVFKSFRLIKFLPNANSFVKSVQRALQSSYIILLGFFVLLFITALISGSIFKNIVPEYFGNPLQPLYSIFQLFSVEGWYEIPNAVAEKSSNGMGFFAKFYFSILLMIGGIMGLSLVNSIFVDAMVSDNNDDLEADIKQLSAKINSLEEKIDQLIQNKNDSYDAE